MSDLRKEFEDQVDKELIGEPEYIIYGHKGERYYKKYLESSLQSARDEIKELTDTGAAAWKSVSELIQERDALKSEAANMREENEKSEITIEKLNKRIKELIAWRVRTADERDAFKAEAKRMRENILKCFPTTWLDPLLDVLGKPPWGCPEIEKLVKAIKKSVSAVLNPHASPEKD